MSGIGRGLLLAFVCTLGVVAGLGGFLTFGLTRVAPTTLAPPAATQEWDVTLEIGDPFLAERINARGEGNPIALRDAQVTSRDDGTVVISGSVAPARGGAATPTTGRPGPPIPLPIGPPRGGDGLNIPAEIILRPGAQDGKLTVDVVRASIGPLPIPPNLGRLLEDPINNQVGNAVENVPFRIIGIATRNGAIVVQARRATP